MVAIGVTQIITDFHWMPKRPGEPEGPLHIESCSMGLRITGADETLMGGELEVTVDGAPILGKWKPYGADTAMSDGETFLVLEIHTIEPHSQADHYDAHKLLCSGKNVEIRALA